MQEKVTCVTVPPNSQSVRGDTALAPGVGAGEGVGRWRRGGGGWGGGVVEEGVLEEKCPVAAAANPVCVSVNRFAFQACCTFHTQHAQRS